jgi:peptidoglycan/LPS O-acetylase OafA/YrhL
MPARPTRIAGVGALLTAALATVLRVEAAYDSDRLLAFGSALLILWAVLPRSKSSRALRLLESRPAVWLGVVSYSVYLWHEPLVTFLGRHGLLATHAPGAAGAALDVAVVLAATAALSALTYRFVEAPAMRRKAPLAVSGTRSSRRR